MSTRPTTRPVRLRCTKPLHEAAREGCEKVVQSLIAAAANVNQADRNGWTPLINAALSGQEKVVQILVAAGANIDQATNDDDITPLYVAATNGHLPVVKLLVAAGSNMQPRLYGKSLIDRVKEAGHKDVVAFLLSLAPNKLVALIARLKLTGKCKDALDKLGVSEVEHLLLISDSELISHGCKVVVARTLLAASAAPTVAPVLL